MDKTNNTISNHFGQMEDYGAKAANLPRLQRLVFSLLCNGGKYSVYDICTRLRLADPRGHISALRNKGFQILDEWRTTAEGARYKVYYLKQGGRNE